MRLLGTFGVLLLAACNGPATDPVADKAAQFQPDTAEPDTADASPEELENALLGSGGVASRMASARPDQPPSTCQEGEDIIFACTMKSGKKASICVTGSGNTGQNEKKFAQYRFGPADAPAELVWPMAPSDGKLAFKSVPYSGGGEAQISFVNGDTEYVVFSRMVRTNFEPGEPNYPAIEDGILIRRGGTVLGELGCGGDVEMPIQYALAEQYSDPAPEMIHAE